MYVRRKKLIPIIRDGLYKGKEKLSVTKAFRTEVSVWKNINKNGSV